jgi:hypothetical protein
MRYALVEAVVGVHQGRRGEKWREIMYPFAMRASMTKLRDVRKRRSQGWTREKRDERTANLGTTGKTERFRRSEDGNGWYRIVNFILRPVGLYIYTALAYRRRFKTYKNKNKAEIGVDVPLPLALFNWLLMYAGAS